MNKQEKRILKHMTRLAEASQDRYIEVERGLMEYANGTLFQRIFFGPAKALAFLKRVHNRFDTKLLGEDPRLDKEDHSQ